MDDGGDGWWVRGWWVGGKGWESGQVRGSTAAEGTRSWTEADSVRWEVDTAGCRP